jgi:hypothetical protein
VGVNLQVKSLPTTGKDWTQLKRPASHKHTRFLASLVKKKKSFITLATGVSVKNFFFFVNEAGTD